MSQFTTRPVIMGTHGMVTAGHYLAAIVGLDILKRGGNAVDAAAATGFALAVLEPQANGIAGEVPLLIHWAKEGKVIVVNGQGPAPQKATLAWFQKEKIDLIPGDGFLPITVPASFSAWLTALMHFGTMSLEEVITPAIELAEDGFPMYHNLWVNIARLAQRMRQEWPNSANIYLPNGEVPQVGEVFRQPEWAKTFRQMVEVEYQARGKGRIAGLEAAHRYFYQQEIAERIVEFSENTWVMDASGKPHTGLLSREDMANYQATLEEPVTFDYRGYTVCKCRPWSQGPVFMQQLNILQGYDLASLGHNSPDYLHLLHETIKLAFADRECYYGDPAFVEVPLAKLLSEEYAAAQRRLIDPKQAMRESVVKLSADLETALQAHSGDTTHLDVVDARGNMVAATPSGGWMRTSPVVEGLGFPLGTRGQLFYLDSKHPNCLAPGKKPRTTLSPSLVLKRGKPYMVFGTPGADQQDQWSLQFFLNHVDFGMNLQQAIDVPTVHSLHFPGSFYPHASTQGRLVVEGRIPEATRRALTELGHDIQVADDWGNGRVLAIRYDPERNVRFGAASPRLETGYAVGW